MKTSTFKNKAAIASAIATAAHNEAGSRYAGMDYSNHLMDVAIVLRQYGFGSDDDLMAAAYLHDTLEDTNLGADAILALFGVRVLMLVQAVTDGPGKNRKERKALTYQRIREVDGATALKLADRIANVTYSSDGGVNGKNPKKFAMYAKEHEEFEKQLRVRGELEPMWQQLNQLIHTNRK